jgi:hypothetical protein
MADLRRTPSLQHAVTLIRDSVSATLAEFEALDEKRIGINLNPGRRLFRPLMEGQPLDWAIRQLSLEKYDPVIKPNIGLVSAFAPYAKEKVVAWFRECDTHPYRIGADLAIPVRPAGFWSERGKLHVLWPQCWKSRTLDSTQRAIFNTILRDCFFVGDFKTAELEWVDLREKIPDQGRSLEVLPGEALGTVTRDDLKDYLAILVSAYEQHSLAKVKRKAEHKAQVKAERESERDSSLFEGIDLKKLS